MAKLTLSAASLALLASLTAMTPIPQGKTLKVGDPAPALQIAEWVKGKPVQSLAKGKIYMIEFWATW